MRAGLVSLRGLSDRERILAGSVRTASGCREWQRGKNRDGYGILTLHIDGKMIQVLAHRLSYETVRGPIPAGLVLDHVVCDNPACVDEWHTEPRTPSDHQIRHRALQTHCKRGHPLSGDNLYSHKDGKRHCRACRSLSKRNR